MPQDVLSKGSGLGIGVGSGYLFETDFKREVYSDLTGERGTLMGCIQGIFAAQYESIARERAYSVRSVSNETVEELTQSLMALVAEGTVWTDMYANCSTTAQRGGARAGGRPFRDATLPVFRKLYAEVASGNEAQRLHRYQQANRITERKLEAEPARTIAKATVAGRRDRPHPASGTQ